MKDMTAAIIIKDRKILLVHNIKHNQQRVEPPGGKKKENESFEDCVIREVREELGILIKPIKLFGIYETQSPEGKFNVYMYLSEIINGNPVLLEPKKISIFQWYGFEELLRLKEENLLVPNLASSLNELRLLLA